MWPSPTCTGPSSGPFETCFDPTRAAPPFRSGGPVGYGNALSQLVDSSSPDKGVGLSLTIPLRNRVAQATQIRSELEYRQSQMRLQQLENQVRIEVRNAQFSVTQNRASVASAQAAVDLGHQSLDAEQKKYALGASTTTLVLQNQSALAQAESTLVSAMAAYEKAQVELDRATGLLLDHAGILIADAERGEVTHMPSIPFVAPRKEVPTSVMQPQAAPDTSPAQTRSKSERTAQGQVSSPALRSNVAIQLPSPARDGDAEPSGSRRIHAAIPPTTRLPVYPLRVTLSVVLITYNEESNLARTLESVRPLVRHGQGEIIVVDSGSTDRTVEIAKSFGAKVFSEAWKGYAAQKNSAIEKATGDWILSLDADEELDQPLQKRSRIRWKVSSEQTHFEQQTDVHPFMMQDAQAELADCVGVNASQDLAGISIARKNYFLGRWIKHGGFWPDPKLRLFRRGCGRFEERAVHETA